MNNIAFGTACMNKNCFGVWIKTFWSINKIGLKHNNNGIGGWKEFTDNITLLYHKMPKFYVKLQKYFIVKWNSDLAVTLEWIWNNNVMQNFFMDMKINDY